MRDLGVGSRSLTVRGRAVHHRHFAPTLQTVTGANALLVAANHLPGPALAKVLTAVVGGLIVGALSLKPPTVATCVGATVGIVHAVWSGNWLGLAALSPLAVVGVYRDVRQHRGRMAATPPEGGSGELAAA